MASNINTGIIDITYPIAGQDNDSQGFRDNFTNINSNFEVAKTEIEALQDSTAVANYAFDPAQVPSVSEDNYVLTYSNSTGLLSLEAASGPALLTSNLDVATFAITTTTTDGNITITPDGTGNVVLGTVEIDADQVLGAGQDNYVLTYDNGTGTASFEAAAGGGGGAPTILDVPEIIITNDGTVASWTTVDNATLAGATATAAILRILINAADSASTASILAEVGVKKTGTGTGSLQNNEKIMRAGTQTDDGSSTTNLTAHNSVEVTVNLDASYDFDWITTVSANTNSFVDIILVGYYT